MDYSSILTEGILKILKIWIPDLPAFFLEHYVLREILLTSTDLVFLTALILSSYFLFKCIKKKSDKTSLAFFCWIMVIAYPTFFRNYWFPPEYYWDENFHLTAAAKYLDHVHFMEPHPPLGKMLIAYGEALFRAKTHQVSTFGFENTDYISGELPEGFTFIGYRFFPAIFGWLCAGIFALVLFEVLGSYFWASIFSSFFIFENSLVVHLRGAMLDSFMLFGCLVCLWGFLRLLKIPKLKSEDGAFGLIAMIFGFTFALLTKLFSLALIILWPMLLWFRKKTDERIFLLKAFVGQLVFFGLCFITVWGYHIYQAKTFSVSLLFSGEYYASSDYEKIINHLPNDFGPVEAFYIQLRDNLRYSFAYEERVPQLDLDSGSRSGTFPIMWPFSSRPISYRWSHAREEVKRYLYLIPNPVVWGLCLLSLILSIGVVFLTLLTGKKIVSDQTYRYLCIFLILYFSLMLPMMAIRRILYIYHYFLPLLLTMLMFAVLFPDLFKHSENKMIRKHGMNLLKLIPVLVMGMFFYFYAFTYYEPQDCQEFNEHGIFRFWNLKAQYCKDPANPQAFLSPPLPNARWQQIEEVF